MNDVMVSIDKLTKKYGDFTAICGLDLKIYKGEVFGLLGPNGAGKTTILECLEGLRKINSGTLKVAGCDPQTDSKSLRKKLGVQLQASSLPDCITVSEAIELICTFSDTAKNEEQIEKFGLKSLLKKQYKQLSTGQRRRVNLFLALTNNPDVVILDEPTAGLDVQSRANLHEEIRAIKQQGITVLLATHDMAEAASLCDRIAILIGGKIAVCGTPDQVTAAGSQKTKILLRTVKGSLCPGCDIDGAEFVTKKDGYLEWSALDITASLSNLLSQIQIKKDIVEDLRVERPSLEERFLALVKGDDAL